MCNNIHSWCIVKLLTVISLTAVLSGVHHKPSAEFPRFKQMGMGNPALPHSFCCDPESLPLRARRHISILSPKMYSYFFRHRVTKSGRLHTDMTEWEFCENFSINSLHSYQIINTTVNYWWLRERKAIWKVFELAVEKSLSTGRVDRMSVRHWGLISPADTKSKLTPMWEPIDSAAASAHVDPENSVKTWTFWWAGTV